MFKVHKAFTLIELLVVIAIIGILASVVVVNVGSARIKAWDAKRMSDIKSIETALELYFDDNGQYPVTTCEGSNSAEWSYCAISSLNTSLVPKYLPSIPDDPQNPGSGGYRYNDYYTLSADGSAYKLFAHVETPSNANISHVCNNGWRVFAVLKNNSRSDLGSCSW